MVVNMIVNMIRKIALYHMTLSLAPSPISAQSAIPNLHLSIPSQKRGELNKVMKETLTSC